MSTRVSIYSPSGSYLTEIECQCSRSWVLDGIGVAQLAIAKSDPKAISDYLNIGRYLFIEHDRVGNWGGLIWTPTAFTDPIQITAYTAEYRLKKRRVLQGSISGTAGEMFETLINMANQQEDTNIVPGIIESGGPIWTQPLNFETVYDILIDLVQKTGQDWSIEPVLTANARLTFLANWHLERGTAYNVRFEEGTHLARPTGAGLTIQGEIANDVVVYGNSGSQMSTIYSNAIDQDSRARYGLQQTSIGIDSTDGPDVTAKAVELLNQTKEPTKVHELFLLDTPVTTTTKTFDYARAGDSVVLRLVNYGWGSQGLGTDIRARIMAREFNEAAGKMALTIQEIA